MDNEIASGYISKIIFNNEEDVDIKQNDIIVFVGPNNAGKSQSLKDIYALSERKMPTMVISDIEIIKNDGSIEALLDKLAIGDNDGNRILYKILSHNMIISNYTERDYLDYPYYNQFRDVFIANLNTSARLNICIPPQSVNRNADRTHPIHYAAFNPKYRKWLSDNFKSAFDIEITPNAQFGAKIPLCIGKPVKLKGKYEDEQERQEYYASILDTYKQVQDQGDGMKSFTGILLYLMLDYYKTYLIDEPESFLHPPQARIMGQIIGKTLTKDQQAFISTHSEDIIKGLLEVCPDRIKIIRITREEDKNFFSVLDNDKFAAIWNDPLLRYSNIMSSLFHKSVVLCESDSDCKMYSIIESHIKQTAGKYSETLFIHCGGKHRMAKIVTALKSLNVRVCVIPDIDVMDNEIVFRGITEACGINWTDIEKDYNTVVGNLHSQKEKINRNEAKTIISRILDGSDNQNLSNKEIKEIQSAIKTISKWENIKDIGTEAIPKGDAAAAFREMDGLLRNNGIYIVPVGTLEGFVKEVGGHGPEWTNKVLEKYPDLDNEVYSKIREFIQSMNL